MVLSLIKRSALVLALIFLLADPADLSSCGPFLTEAVFTRTNAPMDEQAFFAGHLGILQPTYERRYLAMAYRLLSGEPLSSAQIASVSNLERYRMPSVDDELKSWLAARNQVKNPPAIQVDPYRQTGTFENYLNCNAGAFQSARETLQHLILEAGPDSARVHDWLAAQDQVFTNCSGAPSIPNSAPASAPEPVRANRQYQIAAAEFYASQFDQARAAFRQIAADPASPWRAWAPYLIARCYLRQGDYTDAQRQLNAILADPAQGKMHAPARRLLDYTAAKIDPAAQLTVVGKRMLQPDAPDLGHDLNDYTFLYDKLSDPSHANALKQTAAADDLTRWISNFQNAPNPESFAHWNETGSAAWLLVALYHTGASEPHVQPLIDAARALPPASPAYLTAQFETARLLLEAGHKAQAAAVSDTVLRQPNDISTSNAFRVARLKAAANFDDFLTYAPRTIDAEVTPDLSDQPTAPKQPEGLAMFDQDAATAFNRWFPLSLWLDAARDENLAPPLRIELAQSGWIRSVILANRGLEFARELARRKPAYAAGLRPYLGATDPFARQFEAAFFILHHPELQPEIRAGLQRFTPDGKIDNLRDNWWAPPSVSASSIYSHFDVASWYSATLSPILKQLYPDAKIPAPDFLTPEQTGQNAAEQKRLNANGAPSFLAAIILRWANAHPADPRNAEALALAVKTSRFSPTDPAQSNAIEKAFHLLHARYSKTAWAARTPYWYR